MIRCSCGVEILMVPNVKRMSEAIEAHVEQHKQKVKDPAQAATEAERVRDELIAQVLDKASRMDNETEAASKI